MTWHFDFVDKLYKNFSLLRFTNWNSTFWERQFLRPICVSVAMLIKNVVFHIVIFNFPPWRSVVNLHLNVFLFSCYLHLFLKSQETKLRQINLTFVQHLISKNWHIKSPIAILNAQLLWLEIRNSRLENKTKRGSSSGHIIYFNHSQCFTMGPRGRVD